METYYFVGNEKYKLKTRATERDRKTDTEKMGRRAPRGKEGRGEKRNPAQLDNAISKFHSIKQKSQCQIQGTSL